MRSKAEQGKALIAGGVALAIITLIVRSSNETDHKAGEHVSDFVGRAPEAFNNAPYVVAGAIAALLVVCGVILYATGRD